MLDVKRHMAEINLNIEKSSVPLIWLDTSILLEITKTQSGEITNGKEKERAQYLYDAIKIRTQEKKLICPSADQFEEVEIGERLEEEFKSVQRSLSLGMKIKHRGGIEDCLIGRFMKAYIDSEKEIRLSYRDVFDKDPVKELENSLKVPFIVDVHCSRPKEILEKEKNNKKIIPRKWEELRREKVKAGIKFEEEREKEFEAYLGTLLALHHRAIVSILNGDFNIFNLANAQKLIEYKIIWDYCEGQPSGLKGLSQFFSSAYFRKIPTIEIACNLRARIATWSQPIKSGDYMDIEQVSAVLPFFNLVITDRAMKHCLRLLKYPEKFNCTVLSIKDFNEIKSFLDSL